MLTKKDLKEALYENFAKKRQAIEQIAESVRLWPNWPQNDHKQSTNQRNVDSSVSVYLLGLDSFERIALSFIDGTFAAHKPGSMREKFLGFSFPMSFVNLDWIIGLAYFRYRIGGSPSVLLGSILGLLKMHYRLSQWQTKYSMRPDANLWYSIDAIGLDWLDYAKNLRDLLAGSKDAPRDQRFGSLFYGMMALLDASYLDNQIFSGKISHGWFDATRNSIRSIVRKDSEGFATAVSFLYKSHRKNSGTHWDSHTCFWDISLLATFLERIARKRGLQYVAPSADCRDESLIVSPISEPTTDLSMYPGSHFLTEDYDPELSWLSLITGIRVTEQEEEGLYS